MKIWVILDLNNNMIRFVFKVVSVMLFSLCIRLSTFLGCKFNTVIVLSKIKLNLKLGGGFSFYAM
jgi:hypothetical protein